jgi:hypothetical protein
MECFPDPQHTVFLPDAESLTHRRRLRMVMMGMMYGCVAKLFLMGLMSGILQLFTVWMVYYSWATMSSCTLIFVMISTGFDLLTILGGWFTMTSQLGGLLLIMYYGLVAVYVSSAIIEVLAYRCFKRKESAQHGLGGGAFGRAGGFGGMSQYDDPERAPGGARSY